MGLLLDTHIILWLRSDPDRIPDHIHEEIRRTERVSISVVSAWEHELKRAKHPKELPFSFLELIAGSGFQTLDFPFDCHLHAYSLPPIHRDPFDRMLVAHALSCGLVLVTADTVVSRYPVKTLW